MLDSASWSPEAPCLKRLTNQTKPNKKIKKGWRTGYDRWAASSLSEVFLVEQELKGWEGKRGDTDGAEAGRNGQGRVEHMVQMGLWFGFLVGGCKSRLRKLRPLLGICQESAVVALTHACQQRRGKVRKSGVAAVAFTHETHQVGQTGPAPARLTQITVVPSAPGGAVQGHTPCKQGSRPSALCPGKVGVA